MRIHVLSDLHLPRRRPEEVFLPPHVDCDVVVLAGDICDSPIDAAAYATLVLDRPVVYVLGNHEFYGSSIPERLRDAAAVNRTHAGVSNPIHALEDDVVVIGGTRFVGCTLWTDFALFGNGEAAIRQAMSVAKRQVPDFDEILADDPSDDRMAPRFGPRDAAGIHRRSRRFLDDTLSIPFAGPTVVVTHHAPGWGSIAPMWQAAITSAAWASDLTDLIVRHQPDLWIHGHVHDSADYLIGATRVVCNPRGFGVGQPRFDPRLVVEVGPRPAAEPRSEGLRPVIGLTRNTGL